MRTLPVLASLAVAALTSACSSTPAQSALTETPECQSYRAMSAAPMAPDAVQRLRQKCEASRLLY